MSAVTINFENLLDAYSDICFIVRSEGDGPSDQRRHYIARKLIAKSGKVVNCQTED